jgi:hypothetical protein
MPAPQKSEALKAGTQRRKLNAAGFDKKGRIFSLTLDKKGFLKSRNALGPLVFHLKTDRTERFRRRERKRRHYGKSGVNRKNEAKQFFPRKANHGLYSYALV